MRKLALVIGFIVSTYIASPALADTHVNGYYRSNGTYVQPYNRTDPNRTTYDNYSTRGNVNPYTGVAGTRNPDSRKSTPYSNSSPRHQHHSSPRHQHPSYPRY